MNAGLFAQYVMNGLMLGMMYALVAVGFTLFFGVLDVIKFSHGDVLTVGAFTALATYVGLTLLGLQSHWLALAVMLVVATMAMAVLGVLVARYLVMPLRSAPALNTLLITLMLGTVLLPFASAYKDVFAFAIVIAIMAWRPTGLIQEKISERV